MKTLTMESTIKMGASSPKRVSDLVKNKGKIISLIKEGYDFDGEVLKEAHITKTIRETKVWCGIMNTTGVRVINSSFSKDTTPLKQIISELNTITKSCEEDNNEQYYSSYNNEVENASDDDFCKEDE
jgi:hypothetical protein